MKIILSFLQLKQDVLQLLSPELQNLYDYLEMEFDPLHLSSKVVPILDGLDELETLKQYVEPLKEIVLVRLVKQVKGGPFLKHTLQLACDVLRSDCMHSILMTTLLITHKLMPACSTGEGTPFVCHGADFKK